MDNFDKDLFSILRVLRRNLAEKQGVPAYIVFSDFALKDMAKHKPTTLSEFLKISGVGQKKCDTYGEIFTKIIADYCKLNS